ncbi:MAG: CDP-alcohol phosphatidyltransferase family protein [Mucilaginibacter sp.]|nr:CDP-alcohol phosphatidyltransferase family protein [Mucilaginibacter sp.]
MKRLPILLIYSRIVLGAIIIGLSLLQPAYFRAVIITLIALGLISDIFDGIIARRLGISTPKMRRMDSAVDQFFWLAVVASCYIIAPEFFKINLIQILILIGLDAACYIISFMKFRKEVATHAISSKLWTLVLFATLIQIIAVSHSVILFNICIYMGIITRIEIIGIFLIIKNWTNDVPSVYHAVLIRNGKSIKRHKLFNG